MGQGRRAQPGAPPGWDVAWLPARRGEQCCADSVFLAEGASEQAGQGGAGPGRAGRGLAEHRLPLSLVCVDT